MPIDFSTPTILSLSGKGGVGKTLVAIGIASALAHRGTTAVLDIDIRSPNLPYVMGVPTHVREDPTGRPYPNIGHIDGAEVSVFSSAMIFGNAKGITMSGEMVKQTVNDMLRDVLWPEKLDYLVVDVDPGPGDSLQAVADLMRLVGAVVVSTSDISSLNDCRRILDACETKGVDVLGVIGNMIGVECPSCGSPLVCNTCHESVAYGDEEPVLAMAKEYSAPYLGSLPWQPAFKSNPVREVLTRGKQLFDHVADIAEQWIARKHVLPALFRP